MRTAHKAGISAAGAALAVVLISHWEGLELVARHLPFDRPGVVTVCGGITNYDLPGLKVGMRFTKGQCEQLMREAIPRYAAPIARCVPSYASMPPHRQAALASFAYNLGSARICGTSIGAYLNSGNVKAACNAMVDYVRANGKVLKGLVNRRTDSIWGERPWCLRED